MDILFFATAYNGLCQRLDRELSSKGHRVTIELSTDSATMQSAVDHVLPDLIICPFLKHRVPDAIWRQYPCLIVHPGIEGDRGPSSIDWAITQNCTQWGVTLLQADEEMDAGDIWGTQTFICRSAPKASLYRREVTKSAVLLVHQALQQFQTPRFKPRPLNYNNPQVQGRLQPVMRQSTRKIDWQNDYAEQIVRKIHAADSFPGVLDELEDHPVYLFGAREELQPEVTHTPGKLAGQRDGAIAITARDGLVWVRQLKMATQGDQSFFKLPALQVVTQQFSPSVSLSDLPPLPSRIMNDITVTIDSDLAYLEFNFYNGAMNTIQCRQLLQSLRELRQNPDIRIIVLMGGEDFWSNGIHLNCIEAAPDPAHESWLNINAINDVVQEIIQMENKLTIAALRCNAGAGGAIMPLACDLVVARSGVVINPHYRNMGLYGSEYWTYLLPRRVGQKKAEDITQSCQPILVDEAHNVGMIDHVLPESWDEYHQQLSLYCKTLSTSNSVDEKLATKRAIRLKDEKEKPLKSYRAAELKKMKAVFDNPESLYHQLRHDFVYKVACARSPINNHMQDKKELA